MKGTIVQNEPNNRSRLKYLLPWLGMAAIIALMRVAFGD